MKVSLSLVLICLGIPSAAWGRDSVNYFKPKQPIELRVAGFNFSADLDLDRDGTPDYRFYTYALDGRYLGAIPLRGNRELAFFSTPFLASVPVEYTIGPVEHFYSWVETNYVSTIGPVMMGGLYTGLTPSGGYFSGPFVGGRAFMGVAFQIDGALHYGWVRMENLNSGPVCYIVDWAYESRPDTAIRAGAKKSEHHNHVSIVRQGHLRLAWESDPGASYQIQHTSQLGGPWTNVGFIVIATSTNSVVDVPMVNSADFYRVVPVD